MTLTSGAIRQSRLQWMQTNPSSQHKGQWDPHKTQYKTLSAEGKAKVAQQYQEQVRKILSLRASSAPQAPRTAWASPRSQDHKNARQQSWQDFEYNHDELRDEEEEKDDSPSHTPQSSRDTKSYLRALEHKVAQLKEANRHLEDTKHESKLKRHSSSSRPQTPSTSSRRRTANHTRSKSVPRSRTALCDNTNYVAKKSIRSRLTLEQERAAKEKAEYDELQVKFKARDVPMSTKFPKYKAMVEEQRARSEARRCERQARLESSVAPFRGMERRAKEQKRKRDRIREGRRRQEEQEKREQQKKASQAPLKRKDTESYMARKAREDVERRLRIEENARQLANSSRLPPRMEQWENTVGRVKRHLKKTAENQAGITPEHTFKPRLTKRVPDFEQTKRAWESALHLARSEKAPTVPDVSKLSMFSDEERMKRELRAATKRANDSRAILEAAESKLENDMKKKMFMKAVLKAKPDINITKSQRLRLILVAEKHREAENKRLQKEQDEMDRKKRLEKAKHTVTQLVKELDAERQAQPGYLSLEQAERQGKLRAKKNKEQYQAQLKAAKERIHLSKEGRVSLIHSSSEKVKKENARREALSRVALALDNNHHEDVFDDDDLLELEHNN